MTLRLVFGIGDAGQLLQEPIGRFDLDQVGLEVSAERLVDLFGLTRSQQTMVDEDAGELITHGPMDQSGGHRRIDPTGEATDHLAVADLGADPVDRLLDDRVAGPGGASPQTS